ncbi:heme-degrading domain-containing protein [Oerskovia turbata]
MAHDQPANPELTRLIAQAEQHERDLVLTRFTHDDAWRLGCLLVELVWERSLPVAIDVRRGPQQVYHAATQGSVPGNDVWIQRRVREVERFWASSYLMGLRARARDTTFTTWHELPYQEYAAHGGAFPLRLEGVGVVGVVTVSGLAQRDDYLLCGRGAGDLPAGRRLT